MVKQMSVTFGQSLGRQLNYQETQIQILIYGIELLLETIIKLAILVILAFSVGLGIPTLMVLLSYALIRTIGGGPHLSTYPRCLLIGIALLLGFAFLSTLSVNQITNSVLFIVTAVLGSICILKWVPAGTAKKTITDESIRKRQKIRCMGIMITLTISAFFLGFAGFHVYERALIYGSLAAFMLITPLGYQTMMAVDASLDKLTERR